MILAQLMDSLPRVEFQQGVQRYPGGREIRRFSHLDQFYCMAFAQLTGREGLRDIETRLRARGPKLYHLGSRGYVARSTFSINRGSKPAPSISLIGAISTSRAAPAAFIIRNKQMQRRLVFVDGGGAPQGFEEAIVLSVVILVKWKCIGVICPGRPIMPFSAQAFRGAGESACVGPLRSVKSERPRRAKSPEQKSVMSHPNPRSTISRHSSPLSR